MYINELEDEPLELSEQKPKQLITTLLEFLTEDIYWLTSNLTDYHKEMIHKLDKAIDQ